MHTAAVVVCDVTREVTFEAAARWKAELDQLNPELPVILVANKCDLLDDSTSSFIAGARMEAACRKHGFRGWYVTSAKLDLNIDQAMRGLLGHVEAKRREEETEGEAPASSSVEAPRPAKAEARRPEARRLDRRISLTADDKAPKTRSKGCC